MYCPNCGNKNLDNAKFCNTCGSPLIKNEIKMPQKKKTNKIPNIILISLSFVALFLLILTIVVFTFDDGESNYYFNDGGESNVISNNGNTKKSKYTTSIVTGNTYNGISINSLSDAINLIKEDSEKQKSNCPKDIIKIEEEIINLYGIPAVNLCEMDPKFAKELGNVYKKIYNEYPLARGYITNFSLSNDAGSNSVIAYFMPIFRFAYSNSSTSYPWVIKTQVHLASTFFLNKAKLERAISSSVQTGHFPKNATIYSPVAHELGHYLSFLALMRHHNLDSIIMIDDTSIDKLLKIMDDFDKGYYSLEMLKEAYNNYQLETGDLDTQFDDFRGSISKYALAKDNNGNYIYDETIAEAFHDVYLNGNKACTASKYVVNVLKSKLS